MLIEGPAVQIDVTGGECTVGGPVGRCCCGPWCARWKGRGGC